MIGVIDYGLGNVEAFITAYKRLGRVAKRIKTPGDLDVVSHIILPGVGAYDTALKRLKDTEIFEPLIQNIVNGKPILGVCVGFQILAKSSEEGKLPGLAFLNGQVQKFELTNKRHLKCPNMGWTEIQTNREGGLLQGLNGAKFYFLHSYYYKSHDVNNEIAHASHGKQFCCAARNGNVYGVQFHPEKSHNAGLKLLENFSEL